MIEIEQKDLRDLFIYGFRECIAPKAIKQVYGFDNYRVCSEGRIESITREVTIHYDCGRKDAKQTVKGKELKQIPLKKSGYLRVFLRKKGRTYTKYVHRIVAEAFIPNPYNKPEVNHLDGDKENNSVSNLEWATQQENKLHARKAGLTSVAKKRGGDYPLNVIAEKRGAELKYIARATVDGKKQHLGTFDTIEEAEEAVNVKVRECRSMQDLFISAFKYTLGRSTYAVSTMAVLIKDNSQNLSTPDLKLYIREINQAIEDKMCGMDMDCSTWKHLAEWLQMELLSRGIDD